MTKISRIVTLLIVFASSCSGNLKLGISVDKKLKKLGAENKAENVEQKSNTENDPTGKIIERNTTIEDSGNYFQLKNITMLRSSIGTCFGPNMTLITSDMILLANGNSPPLINDGRKRFLLPTYNEGDDIIESERSSLVDPDVGARAAASADGLTDTYLRSLSLIGDVVAHNCSASNAMCACETPTAALEMLTKCIPSIDPNSSAATDASLMLSSVCSQGSAGMRRAVSSLISSYAFGLAR